MKKRLIALVMTLLMVLAPLAAFAETEDSTLPVLSFETTTLDGEPYTSSEIKNYDLILVNFWGEWCGPCKWELPYLQQVSENYPNVLVLGVWYGNDRSGALSTAQEAGVTYPLINPKGALSAYLNTLTAFPTTFFFDCNGNQLGDAEVGAMSYDGWEYTLDERFAMLPPKVTLQPTPVTVNEGETATFKVKAARVESIQWQYQKPGESTWRNVNNNGTSPVLSLTAAARHNGYTYRCKLSNEGGSVYSGTAKLTVKCKPVITAQPAAVTVTAGQKATFKVAATGYKSIQWQYQKPGATAWTNVSVNGTALTYSLTAADRHNGYTYRCKLVNDVGTVYSITAKLTVNPAVSKPVIATQPTAATVTAGQKATFTVKATGQTSIQWQYQKPGTTTWTNVSVNGTSLTYTLTAAARHNGYTYRCKLTNAAGTVYSSAVKLTVKIPPVITEQPVPVTVNAGQTATFKVVATGATGYRWQYQKPGETIWNNVTQNGTGATLNVNAAARHNGYTYRCKLTNENGSVYSAAVKLTVK